MSKPREATNPATLSPAGLAWLAGLVLVANASIMMIELVAGRLTARYLGQSLYTWTAIIGVVMAGMATGHYLGGRLADRRDPLRLISGVLFLSAVGCLSTLALNRGFGEWPLVRGLESWPARIFVHTVGTFLLPCVLLGAISPAATTLAVQSARRPGRVIGLIYALAAAGSLGGTFLTGFYLIATLPVTTIIVTASAVLLTLGLACVAVLCARPPTAVAVRVVAAPAATDAATAGVAGFARFLPFLLVFLSNAAFMVFELAASRMATQHLGHSLYTWTTLLGVVLAGILLGNYVGGLLADRHVPGRLLTWLFGLSALACVAVPAADSTLGYSAALQGMSGIRHIAVHIGTIFFLPAAFLGTIGPVAAKMALATGRRPGQALGAVYAAGALGALLGTFATGYVLIQWLWPYGTILALAALLAVAAALLSPRAIGAHAVAAVCLAALLVGLAKWPSLAWLGDVLRLREPMAGPRAGGGVDYVNHSQYSFITIHHGANPAERMMVLDQLEHSKGNITAPTDLQYEYMWIYRGVVDRYFLDARPVSACLIGGGGFTFPHYLERTRPGSHIEVIEIDPAVTEAAHAAFGFPRATTVQVFTMDARNRIEDLVRRRRAGDSGVGFDVIFGDNIACRFNSRRWSSTACLPACCTMTGFTCST